MDLSRLALFGLLGAAVACDGAEPPAAPAAAPAGEAAPPAAAPAAAPVMADSMGAPPSGAVTHTDVHECAGRNSCKGLGGCKVSAESLTALATAMGTPADAMGAPHDCAGLNACKGLGACAVDETRLASLKAKLAPAHP